MLQHVTTLLNVFAAIAAFMFSFGLNLKLFNFIDYMTGAMKHRNTFVLRSLAYMVFYSIMIYAVLPYFSASPAKKTVQGGDITVQKVASVSSEPEPIDTDVEKIPGENVNVKDS